VKDRLDDCRKVCHLLSKQQLSKTETHRLTIFSSAASKSSFFLLVLRLTHG
jgi:hypothetical protein